MTELSKDDTSLLIPLSFSSKDSKAVVKKELQDILIKVIAIKKQYGKEESHCKLNTREVVAAPENAGNAGITESDYISICNVGPSRPLCSYYFCVKFVILIVLSCQIDYLMGS